MVLGIVWQIGTALDTVRQYLRQRCTPHLRLGILRAELARGSLTLINKEHGVWKPDLQSLNVALGGLAATSKLIGDREPALRPPSAAQPYTWDGRKTPY